jgi:hypothetical protein
MKSIISKLLVFILLGAGFTLYGQVSPYCSPNTITTNPDITGGFDWRLDELNNGEVYIPTGPQQVSFGSPFYYPQGQPNLVVPAIPLLKDFKPEDGWEVVYYDFGTPVNAVNDPIFVLYNRYKSILRVFVLLINDDAEAKKAMLFLEWGPRPDNVKMGNAYLSAYKTPMDAMDNFNSNHLNIQFAKPNEYVVDQHFWLFADFPIIYDPCICGYETYLRFRASLVQESEIEMMINQAAINNSQVVQNGNTQTGSDWFKATFSGVQNVEKSTKLIKDSFTLVDISETGLKQSQTSGGSLKNLLNAGILSTASSWLKGISGVMNLLDYFVAGGSDDHKGTNVAIIPASTAKGTITTSNDYVKHQILAPGADGMQYIEPKVVPLYHNPLGVINLTEAPQLEYIDYNMLLSYPTGAVLPNGQNIVTRLPKVRQYRLKEEIKYAFNVHSNLEIESIEGSFLYRVGGPIHNFTDVSTNDYVSNIYNGSASNVMHGPIGPANTKPIDFNNYEESLFEQGIEINRWEIADNDWLDSLTYKTHYTPLSCLQNNQFRVFINKAYEWGGGNYGGVNNPEIYFRLRAILKRKDGKGEPIVFVATYNVAEPSKVTLEEQPMCDLVLDTETPITYVQDLIGNGFSNYSYHVEGFTTSSDPSWTNMFDDVENVLTLSSPNVYPAGDYFGLYELNLQGNSSQSLIISGTSDIVSGQYINVNNNVELTAGVTLRIDPNEMYPGCWDFVEPVNNQYLEMFCSSFFPYYTKTQKSGEGNEFLKLNETMVVISPNPAYDLMKISFSGGEVSSEIWVTDLSGKIVIQKASYLGSSITIPVGSVSSGMYIVFVRINGRLLTEKLIISKVN